MKGTLVLLLVVLTGVFTAATAPLFPRWAPADPALMMLSGAALIAGAAALKRVSS